jgi:hypothetical protein
VEVNSVVITNGAELWITSNEITASALAASINAKVSTPLDYTAEASGNTVTILGLQADGDASNDYVVKTTCAGNVCVGKVQFQITNTNGATMSVDNVNVNGANLLTAGSITGGSNTPTMAAAIAADINKATFAAAGAVAAAHGYVACAIGSTIFISKAVTQSSDPKIPVYFVISGTGTGNSGNGIFEVGAGGGSVVGMAVSLIITGTTIIPVGRSSVKYYDLFLTITGGVAPYQSPVWYGGTVQSLGSGIYRVQATQYYLTVPHVYCVVTDSSLATAQSNTL